MFSQVRQGQTEAAADFTQLPVPIPYSPYSRLWTFSGLYSAEGAIASPTHDRLDSNFSPTAAVVFTSSAAAPSVLASDNAMMVRVVEQIMPWDWQRK